MDRYFTANTQAATQENGALSRVLIYLILLSRCFHTDYSNNPRESSVSTDQHKQGMVAYSGLDFLETKNLKGNELAKQRENTAQPRDMLEPEPYLVN